MLIRSARKLKRRLENAPEFQVLGERCSGTNFVARLLAANFPMEPGKGTAWKHGFPNFEAAPDRVVFVVVFREAFGWISSMYGKPWHTIDAMRALSFSDFIRNPWITYVDNPTFFGLAPDTVGKPLNLDLHPVTGKPFENILAMRQNKMEALLSLPMRGAKTVFVTHSEVSQDPTRLFAELSDITGLKPKKTVNIPKGHFGYRWSERKVSNDPNVLISEDDRRFILNNLDPALEKKAGFDYHD